MQLFSKIISYVFHPVLMPILGLLVLYFSNDSIREGSISKVFFQSVYLLATVSGLIIVTSLLLLLQGVVRTLETKNTRERLILMAFALVYLSFYYLLLLRFEYFQIGMHPLIFSAISGALFAAFITMLITTVYRISAHMVGIAGIAGMLYGLNFITLYNNPYLLAAIFVLSGIIFSARWTRKAHSVDQLISGFVLGFGCTYLFVTNQIQLSF